MSWAPSRFLAINQVGFSCRPDTMIAPPMRPNTTAKGKAARGSMKANSAAATINSNNPAQNLYVFISFSFVSRYFASRYFVITIFVSRLIRNKTKNSFRSLKPCESHRVLQEIESPIFLLCLKGEKFYSVESHLWVSPTS